MTRSTCPVFLLLSSSLLLFQLSCAPPPTRSASPLAEAADETPVETTIPVPGLTVGTKHVLRSSLLEEDRELLVYLPNGYEDSSDRRYPLFVVLDARASFRPMESRPTCWS